MTKIPTLPLLCVTALFTLPGSLAAQGEQTLRTTAKKGASVWLLQEQKQEQSIDQGGQQMEMGNTTTHTLHVTVLDVDDKGTLTVQTEVVRIHGAMTGPMGEGEFDSAAPAEDEDDGNPFSAGAMSKSLMKGAGKKFTAKVDSRGKVLSLEGTEELLKGGGGRMGGGPTESSLKQMVEGAFGMMPEQPIAVGGSWDHVQSPDGARIPAQQKMKLTLSKMDDASFEITAAGTIEKTPAKADDGKEDDPAAAMMKNMDIQNGKITAMQHVSRQDGFLIDSTQTLSMDLEIDSPMGSASVGVKMTTTIKRTTAEAAMPKKAEKAAPAKEEKPKEEKKEGGM